LGDLVRFHFGWAETEMDKIKTQNKNMI